MELTWGTMIASLLVAFISGIAVSAATILPQMKELRADVTNLKQTLDAHCRQPILVCAEHSKMLQDVARMEGELRNG